MYIIIMGDDKTLTTTKRINLYEGDNLADKLRFLFPQTYKDIDLNECIVKINYTDLSGEKISEVLIKDEELYKNRLSYRYPVDSKFTEFYGEIVYYISFSNVENDVLFYTETHVIRIYPREDSIAPEEIIPENSASKILKEVHDLKEKLDNLEKNGIPSEAKDAVKYTEQNLTNEQKTQARENIGAIDENTLVEYTEERLSILPQSNWEQNDETQGDYIVNRPFYEYCQKGELIASIYTNRPYFTFGQHLGIYLEKGKKYIVSLYSEDFIIECGTTLNLGKYSITLETDLVLTTLSQSGYEFAIFECNKVIVPLDEKFIPETIVRFEIEDMLELPDVSLEVSDDSNGNVTIVFTGVDVVDNGNGNVNISSDNLSVLDDGIGNITLSI